MSPGADGFARSARVASAKSEGSWAPVVFDHAAVALDEHRSREPLIGMSPKNAAKNFGLGRLRIGAQRRVERLGQQRRAHVDVARSSAQRQIALEPQMLNGEREDGEDRKGDADDDRRWNSPPPNRGAGRRACARSSAALGRRAHAAAKRTAPSPPSA